MPSDKSFRLGLVGARGRMGRQVQEHVGELKHVALTSVLLREGTEALGLPPAVTQTSELAAFARSCDVVLDFSAPAVAASVAPVCAQHGRPYVVASTALSQADEAALVAAEAHVPVLVAANVSLGVTALEVLLEEAGRLLSTWDAELIETHHRHKRDAPSGTAKALGQALMRGTGPLHEELRGAGRTAPRPERTLGYSVVRGGDVPGDHTVLLLGQGERLELSHRAQSPKLFAQGALVACQYLAQAGRKPGRYRMRDVLLGQAAPSA